MSLTIPTRLADVAVVAIGRNEGERLQACLRSVIDAAALVVYVDSGSTDDSVGFARSIGVIVVQLDMSVPFTAARARNAGWRRVRELAPHLTLVQFVDGDCSVAPAWLNTAVAFLDAHPDVVSVCGRRRERHPEHSVFNRLCDIEWDLPAGETHACGGDVLTRLAPLEAVGGYRDASIAGEEPELCVRLRAAGWRIWRLTDEMTQHDAAMTRLSQWWKRSLRTGYAYAEGAALHGGPPERHNVRESRSALAWGLGWPALVAGAAALVSSWAALGLLAYPAQVLRLALRSQLPSSMRWPWAFFIVLGKFPEAAGQLRYLRQRRSARPATLIEYK